MSLGVSIDGIRDAAQRAEPKSGIRATAVSMVIFLLLGIALSWSLSAKLGHEFIVDAPDNTWFQADTGRVYSNMVWREANHYRVKVHPLFSLATNLPVNVLKLAGIRSDISVRIVLAAAAGIVLAGLFLALRLVGSSLPNAAIFTLVAATSSSFVFFCAIPETFLFGSLTVVATTIFCASLRTWRPKDGWFIAIIALSMSMATTNGSTGFFATWLYNRWQKVVRLVLDGLLVVIGLWVVEKFIFPTAVFFLGDREETGYISMKVAGTPLTKMPIILLHSMVLPTFANLNAATDDWPAFSIQHVPFAYSTPLGTIGVLIWASLLLWGLFNLCTRFTDHKFRAYLLLSLGFQIALHNVYGDETFLYSLHWLPLLVLVAYMATLRKWGALASLLGGALIVCNAVNNGGEFLSAAALLRH